MKHLLALLLLATPAIAGKTFLEKQPSCAAGAPVRTIVEREVLYLNPVLAIARTRAWVKAEKARRMAQPCETPRRVRSPKDERCYLRSRLP